MISKFKKPENCKSYQEFIYYLYKNPNMYAWKYYTPLDELSRIRIPNEEKVIKEHICMPIMGQLALIIARLNIPIKEASIIGYMLDKSSHDKCLQLYGELAVLCDYLQQDSTSMKNYSKTFNVLEKIIFRYRLHKTHSKKKSSEEIHDVAIQEFFDIAKTNTKEFRDDDIRIKMSPEVEKLKSVFFTDKLNEGDKDVLESVFYTPELTEEYYGQLFSETEELLNALGFNNQEDENVLIKRIKRYIEISKNIRSASNEILTSA